MFGAPALALCANARHYDDAMFTIMFIINQKSLQFLSTAYLSQNAAASSRRFRPDDTVSAHSRHICATHEARRPCAVTAARKADSISTRCPPPNPNHKKRYSRPRKRNHRERMKLSCTIVAVSKVCVMCTTPVKHSRRNIFLYAYFRIQCGCWRSGKNVGDEYSANKNP